LRHELDDITRHPRYIPVTKEQYIYIYIWYPKEILQFQGDITKRTNTKDTLRPIYHKEVIQYQVISDLNSNKQKRTHSDWYARQHSYDNQRALAHQSEAWAHIQGHREYT
jgi:hypothetical protein